MAKSGDTGGLVQMKERGRSRIIDGRPNNRVWILMGSMISQRARARYIFPGGLPAPMRTQQHAWPHQRCQKASMILRLTGGW